MKTYDSKIRKTAWTLMIMLPVFAIWGFTMDSGNEKVTICHIPPGNPENAHSITISENAVAAHIANHGDYIGRCGQGDPEEGNE